MSRRTALWMVVGMVLGAAGVWELTARAQGPAPGFRPFASKVIVVLTKGNVGATLEGADIRAIGNRTFLVGRPTKSMGDYTRDSIPGSAVRWVPLDDVTEIAELPAPANDEKKSDSK
jgi:hypothetical protein